MTGTLSPISMSLWREDPKRFADELGRSFRDIGFAVIVDHGLSQDTIDDALSATRDFFALTEAEKRTYFDPDGGGQRGYTPFGTESAKGETAIDQKEFWHTGRSLPPGHPFEASMASTPSVPEVPEFEPATRSLYDALDDLGRTLLQAVAIHLDLPNLWFEDRVKFGNSILRLLHYPPQSTPPPTGSVRAAAHEDINVITLLLGAEEAGLEVFHREHNRWLPVQAPDGGVVINVGDMLQRLTNDVLPSTSHRVVNPEPERSRYARYSTPFFLHFTPDTLIESLPQCVAEAGVNHYPTPITAQDYLMERLREIGLVPADTE